MPAPVGVGRKIGIVGNGVSDRLSLYYGLFGC
jgi:hypothetical protein